MPYEMVVLIKQVPDTKNITAKAMNDDGTVNRSALPAIFNPEDLNALEMALGVRDAHGGHVTIVSMGPPSAAAAMREALMRGADAVALLSDRAFAVADTLATAYALSCAIRRIGEFDLLFCGRQAIDGDTAQVGPQLAGALDVPQITYAREILHLAPGRICVRRLIEGGTEVVEAPLPCLLTVVGEANEPRPRRAKLAAQFKRARTRIEVREAAAFQLDPEKGKPDPALLAERVNPILADLERHGLLIPVWAPADVAADPSRCGAAGSPTKVKTIESVVLVASEHKKVEPTKEAVGALIHELAEEHVFD
ncbi:MAG TPA: electron transfer flavoprotein subunit beta/FixA family protein [Planctomycetota bacterium]|nr:electron transfer flavoprotein subunit beta/FixA family protein [Planctomycetota bacterium]